MSKHKFEQIFAQAFSKFENKEFEPPKALFDRPPEVEFPALQPEPEDMGTYVGAAGSPSVSPFTGSAGLGGLEGLLGGGMGAMGGGLPPQGGQPGVPTPGLMPGAPLAPQQPAPAASDEDVSKERMRKALLLS